MAQNLVARGGCGDPQPPRQFVYIWIRFGDLWYSLAAVAALCFNVSVCLGAIAISVMVGSRAGRRPNIEEFAST